MRSNQRKSLRHCGVHKPSCWLTAMSTCLNWEECFLGLHQSLWSRHCLRIYESPGFREIPLIGSEDILVSCQALNRGDLYWLSGLLAQPRRCWGTWYYGLSHSKSSISLAVPIGRGHSSTIVVIALAHELYPSWRRHRCNYGQMMICIGYFLNAQSQYGIHRQIRGCEDHC
jgi:hypothetical protein